MSNLSISIEKTGLVTYSILVSKFWEGLRTIAVIAGFVPIRHIQYVEVLLMITSDKVDK
jgi:hypothetical protein